MVLKKVAGGFFILAFLMATRLYLNFGREFVPLSVAKYGFIIFGLIGLILNLLSFKYNNKNIGYNFFYWLGSIVVFSGLLFRVMNWSYNREVLIGGMVILGASFFIPTSLLSNKEKKNKDLLDDL